MMPFTPLNDNIERVIENLTEGLPEEDAPAASGGIGADEPDIGDAGKALQQEGALDEALEQNQDK